MGTPKILVIDDEKDYGHLVEFELQKHGYEVLKAENGKTGLAFLSSQKPSLVILDIKMPEMDGEHFIKEALKLKKDIPIIILSNYVASETSKKHYLDIGAKAVLSKKDQHEDMLKVIRELLKP